MFCLWKIKKVKLIFFGNDVLVYIMYNFYKYKKIWEWCCFLMNYFMFVLKIFVVIFKFNLFYVNRNIFWLFKLVFFRIWLWLDL